MEDLTKQQIVLLTLLVSFVTSIATGIVTVALMEQAPPGVSQTINRVVERTIETVVQAPAQSAAVVTKETIVVKEDDLIMQTVDKAENFMVRIISEAMDGYTETVGLGVVLSKDGLIAFDSQLIELGAMYKAKLRNGKIYPLVQVLTYEQGEFSIYKIKTDEKDLGLTPAVIGDSQKVKLGQSIVMLGGKNATRVQTGIISGLNEKKVEKDNSATTTAETKMSTISSILTDIGDNNATRGEILVNLSGEVVGIRLFRDYEWVIMPTAKIEEALLKYSEKIRVENLFKPAI